MLAVMLSFLATATATVPLLTLDFSVDDGGLSRENGLQWGWGEADSGPFEGGANGQAWATRPTGNYLNDATEALSLPGLDLSNAARPVLSITHWFDMDQTGTGDAGWIEIQNEGEWSRIEPVMGYPSSEGFSGPSEGWQVDWFVLEGVTNASDIRLVFAADSAVARSGWYISDLSLEDGDPIPPVVSGVVEPGDTQDVEGPIVVEASVRDDLQVDQVAIHWAADGASAKSRVMERVSGDTFRGEIPGMDPATRVEWWITATDGENNTQWPVDHAANYRVYLAQPTDLRAPALRPDGSVAAQTLNLEWDAPDSPHSVTGYRVFRNMRSIANTVEPSGAIDLVRDEQRLTVQAEFDTPEGTFLGDMSAGLEIFALLPSMTEMRPDHGWQGDMLRVTVTGENLFFSADSIALDLGEGVDTLRVELIDANSALFTIQIAETAPVGEREAILFDGTKTLYTGIDFSLGDGTDRPKLLKVSPSRIRQGQNTTVSIQANVPMGANPIVDLGVGIFVDDVRVEGDWVHLNIASASTTPLGDHNITIDDGTRVLDGTTLTVRDTIHTPNRVCAVAMMSPEFGFGTLGFCMFWVGRRRQR
jgi:hypothetical protein